MKTVSLLGLLGLALASQAHAVQSIDLTAGMAGGDALAASATSLFMTTAYNDGDDLDTGGNFNFSGVVPLMAGGAVGSMEAFAGHPAGEYDIGRFDGSTSTATEGSVYKLDNIAINAGDILSFEWTFYTNEPVSGAMKDAAYFSLLNHTTALIATADGVNGDAGLSGFRAATSGVFSQTVAASGVYSLVFAVVDTDDVTNSSALGINNLAITPVPEPRDWMLMLAGIGLVGLMVGRNRRRLV
ncbi:MAG: hypothetical protein LDL16_02825 [Thiobacillus sp.]|nr:hypothetical protein [Thiobacillus sp.]